MRNKGNDCFFNLRLSPALMKENLKLFWALPVLTFLAYFFATIMPILIRNEREFPIGPYVEEVLTLRFAPNWFLFVIITLVASVLSLGYYHKPTRAFTLHAQPFSRSKLFNSNIISSWLMITLPLIIIALMYLLAMGEVNAYGDFYTAKMVGIWLINSISVTTFYYGVFTFLGVMVGNSILQVLLSGVFFFISYIIAVIVSESGELFLPGYAGMPDYLEWMIRHFNPFFTVFFGNYQSANSLFTLRFCLPYLAVGLVLLILSHMITKLAKLEKIGDSILFRATEEIITLLLVFAGMSFFGFFFTAISYSKSIFMLGIFIGILITFFIVKLIINRSIKIFNKKNLYSLISCFLLALIFSGFTVFNLQGYEKKLPEKNEIRSVEIDGFPIPNHIYSLGGDPSLRGLEISMEDSKEIVTGMLELQEYIQENKLYIATPDVPDAMGKLKKEYKNSSFYGATYITFEYHLKNGSTFKRFYRVLLNDQVLDKIMRISSSEEVINQLKVSKEFMDKVLGIRIENYNYDYIDPENESPITIHKKDDILAILNAVNKEIEHSNFSEQVKESYQKSGFIMPHADTAGGRIIGELSFLTENTEVFHQLDISTNSFYLLNAIKKAGYDFRSEDGKDRK